MKYNSRSQKIITQELHFGRTNSEIRIKEYLTLIKILDAKLVHLFHTEKQKY